jgi:prophage antirepressor-like protein
MTCPALFQTSQAVHVTSLDGNPSFVAKDLCYALGIKNSKQALSYPDEDEKGVITNHTLRGLQEMSIIYESDLFNLILKSQKPKAKAFKKWVTGDAAMRVIAQDGGPWFLAKEVCDALGLGSGNLSRDLDTDEQGIIKLMTLKGMQESKIINESGLYSLILKSRKPEAKAFKKWVTRDVLLGEEKMLADELELSNSVTSIPTSSSQ